MDQLRLWCYIEGQNDCFGVSISPDNFIDDLCNQIYKDHVQFMVLCAASMLRLTKVDVNIQTIKELIKARRYPGPSNGQLLNKADPISDVWPSQPLKTHLNVYVRLPDGVGGSTIVASSSDTFLDSDLVKEYDDIFVNVNQWGAFDSSDIERNDIRVWIDTMMPVPSYVAELEQELQRKRGLAPDEYDIFKTISDVRFLDAYFGHHKKVGSPVEFIFERESHNESPRRNARRAEVIHLSYIASGDWERFWHGDIGDNLREPLMSGIFFQGFIFHAGSMITARIGNYSWPFKLIMKCPNIENISEQLRTFRPSSDFMVYKSNLPRLLVEVNSEQRTEWPEDLVRMLLIGATVVRFANKFLHRFKGKFVLFAMYIWDNGRVTRYSLFQEPTDNAVRYRVTSYSLNSSAGRAEFARQLYNLQDVLDAEGASEDMNAFDKLQTTINKHDMKYPLKSFCSRGNNSQGVKRKRPGGNDGNSGAGAGAGGVHATDCAELRAHGYEVKPEVRAIADESGENVMELLSRMPTHIVPVYHPSVPSKELIAKKVREQSDELEILTYLNNLQPNSEHIISLHASFQTQSTSWIILPRMDSIKDYVSFAPKQLYGKFAKICWGFIRGVAYLHELRIAHRDIKPANILLDRRDFCVKMIDFDLAIQVEDEDEEVNDQCGSEHWMAPEVEKKSMYSPIKADRWSSGQVLSYLSRELENEDKYLRSIAGKLTTLSPNRRLSMLEIAPPVSDVTNVAGDRKVLRSLQDIVEGDNCI